jgi:hypothetical protein
MSKNFAKGFCGVAWVGLALLSGCGQASGAAEAAAPSVPGDSLSAQAGRAPALPVRVSRSFFNADVSGTIRIQGQDAETGAIRWSEAPAGADSLGCAAFPQAGGVELCFNLMNDVDSFGVNAREMAASGIADYLGDRLGQPCPGVDWEVALASASRLPATVSSRAVTSFEVRFTAQAPASSGCAAQPVSVDFSFQK